jgi:hypothetical protein
MKTVVTTDDHPINRGISEKTETPPMKEDIMLYDRR